MSEPIFLALEAARTGTTSLVLASGPLALVEAARQLALALSFGLAPWRGIGTDQGFDFDVGGARILVRHNHNRDGARGLRLDGFLWIFDREWFSRAAMEAAYCACENGTRLVGTGP